MTVSSGKIQELIKACHTIAYEGFTHTSMDKPDGEANAMFQTIIFLLSKAIGAKEK